jgi:phosphatidylserine/phosphatidylglycerophosphate/cardiolipin synthase-like enzyme
LTSDGLSTYIGYALYSSDEVALVSPWISDITVKFPVNDVFDDRRMLLSEAVRKLEGKTRVNVLIRAGEEHNNYIRSELAETVQVHSIDDLHAKCVVTPEHVYTGSANITRGGLYINRELCQINENPYTSVSEYLREELSLYY